MPAYAKETTPIYKCRRSQVSLTGTRGCGFLFAPVDYTAARAVEQEIDLSDFIEEDKP
jgi:hypothetical protein